mgnify:CR=1 FL=1
MKRLLAWVCSLLSAIGITACDYINVKELQPGVSTATEVRERFGPPHMEWRNDDGSVTWEFSRQPEGVECFMITIGADNILRTIDQVLNEQTFARVEKGMNGDHVRRLLGKPASSQHWTVSSATFGVSSLGLNTTALPASSAGTICPLGKWPGKL